MANRVILYDPHFNLFSKRPHASIIFSQLEYWFSKYMDGFYKFMEPCDHSHYREGDSWTEELSLSRKVFNRAFDLIGVRYKSKSAFDKAADKFQGKLYASYYDRNHNKTYYIRNHEFIGQVFSFSKKITSLPEKPSKNERPLRTGHFGRSPIYKDTKSITKFTPSKSPSLLEKNNILGKKTLGEEGDSLKEIKKETSPKEGYPILPLLSDSNKETAKKMYEIWREQTKGLIHTPSLSQKLSQKLLKALDEIFLNSLQTWEAHCKRIGSSAFLTGQTGGTFKLWLIRAIQPEVVEKVRAGEYGVDTSIDLDISQSDKQSEALKTSQLQEEITESSSPDWEKSMRRELLQNHGVDPYKAWIKDLSFRLEAEGDLTVFCQSRFKADWVRQKFSKSFDALVETSQKVFSSYQIVSLKL